LAEDVRMRRHAPKIPLLLGVFAFGCGAIAVVGEGGGPADGDATQCSSVAECCEQVCTFAASLPCFDEAEIEQAVQCHEDGVVLSCSVCPNKRERVAEKCEREVRCSAL